MSRLRRSPPPDEASSDSTGARAPDSVALSANSPPWHCLELEQVLHQLKLPPEHQAIGLGSAEAQARLRSYGPNALPEQGRSSTLALLLAQFTDFMILVLLGAAIISGLIGEPKDAIAILVIVLLNATIGGVQQFRAERAIAALRRMAVPEAVVLREGSHARISASELVPGDIVMLEAGNAVPADLRLFNIGELQLDESALTGESTTVSKQSAPLSDPELPPGDRSNLAFSGSMVTRGRASGVVIATGANTELGRIANLLSSERSARTPLQLRLARFGRLLALAVLVICAVVFVAGLLQGQPALLMFLTAVSLAVAAIPEALPAVVTIALAFGARRLIRERALVRNLPAVETLGSVTCICTDKTGTLTQNRMTVERCFIAGHLQDTLPNATEAHDEGVAAPAQLMGRAMALNNDVTPRSDGRAGEPTELALYQSAHQSGYVKQTLEARYPRIGELPFDSERKRMTTLHQDLSGGVIAYCKGAPERILERCSSLRTDTGTAALDAQSLLGEAESLANQGYRVLAFAMRSFPTAPEPSSVEAIERELEFLGLVALIDPPRPEVPAAVADCAGASITPVMITGDHPGTAFAIAHRLGISDDRDAVLTGSDLASLDEAGLAEAVATTRVYARVSPEQKLHIVRALQARGEFVAMTGDGVNDAPALKRANIGVAMGDKGTDVARGAADMVLLDDNFATIVQAVRAGRRIFDNIRKFVKDTMSSNSGEIWTLFLAPLMGLPIPLLPIHILWINLVTDGLPGLAFTAEPAEPGIMRRKPRPPSESLFAHGMWQHIIWVGLFVGAISIASQAWAISRGVEYWQTVVFTVLTISQLFHSLSVRSETASLFTIGLRSNLPMLGAVLLMFTLQLAVIYVPAFNGIFHTQPLPLSDLMLCVALSSLVLFAVEAEKWLVRRGWLYQSGH